MSYETDFEEVDADEEEKKPENRKSLLDLEKTFAFFVKTVILGAVVIYAISLYNLSF